MTVMWINCRLLSPLTALRFATRAPSSIRSSSEFSKSPRNSAFRYPPVLSQFLPSPHCDVNTNRTTQECVARGNALYAFYTAFFGEERYTCVLSGLCDDVVPVFNASTTAKEACLKRSELKCKEGRGR